MRSFLARLGSGFYFATLETVCRLADRFESRPDVDDPLPGQIVGSGYRARCAGRGDTQPPRGYAGGFGPQNGAQRGGQP